MYKIVRIAYDELQRHVFVPYIDGLYPFKYLVYMIVEDWVI